MKRIISTLVISSVLLAACTKNISLSPGISFLTPEPEILEETAIFRVIGQPFSSIDSLIIPVTFGGSAKRGVDYEASADHFTFRGDNLTDSIVISTLQLGTGRTLNLSLQIPEGFTAGRYATSEFRLQDKYGLLHFESSRGFIADTTDYIITLTDSTGMAKVLSADADIQISVNPEKSTAEEGVDFKFISETPLTIAAGSGYTSFRICPLGNKAKQGKEKIVLNIVSDYRFEAGETQELELNIIDYDLKVLDGTWLIDTLLTDSLHYEKIWAEACTGYSLVPEYSFSDEFKISFLHGLFSPEFRSGFRNYFIDDSNISFGQEIEIKDIEGNIRKVRLMSLDKTNRYFTASETSTDSLSFVGFHLSKDKLTEKDMMELYVLDHTSRSFMPELESGNKYGSQKPVAAEPGLYLCATFKKY